MTLPLRPSPPAPPRRAAFTLVELLVSMTILSMVMVMLLLVTQGVQRTWKLQEGRAKIYQNSRTVFDVVERDIRCLVTSNTANQAIGFHVFAQPDATYNRLVCFVATTEPDANATSRLCEITYSFSTTSTDSSVVNRLRRQCVSNNQTGWDFYNLPANWWDNTAAGTPTPETVVGGVEAFAVDFYDTAGNKLAAGDDTDLPLRAVVNVTLFDESYSGASQSVQRFKTKRAFTKIFYLGNTP